MVQLGHNTHYSHLIPNETQANKFSTIYTSKRRVVLVSWRSYFYPFVQMDSWTTPSSMHETIITNFTNVFLLFIQQSLCVDILLPKSSSFQWHWYGLNTNSLITVWVSQGQEIYWITFAQEVVCTHGALSQVTQQLDPFKGRIIK